MIDETTIQTVLETLEAPGGGTLGARDVLRAVMVTRGEVRFVIEAADAAGADELGLPFLGELPLNVEVRRARDAGTPIAATDSPLAKPYHALAQRLVSAGAGKTGAV